MPVGKESWKLEVELSNRKNEDKYSGHICVPSDSNGNIRSILIAQYFKICAFLRNGMLESNFAVILFVN